MIDFSQVTDILLGASVVEQIADSLGNILWRASAETDDYFWIENLTSSNMTVTIKKTSGSAPTVVLYRSSDKTTWTSMGNSSTTGRTATVPANSKMYFKATKSAWSTIYYSNYITTNANCKIGGNIMSLIYGDNYKNQTTLTDSYALTLLFYNFTTLTDASELKLPATTLSLECYRSMFSGCTSLTTAPALPATTLTNSCYSNMFYNCSALTTAPELPATTLGRNCYAYMFQGCTALTQAPELPATTLTQSCYQSMFQNCSSLNYVKTYAEDISATSCLNNWLDGVANSGDFYNLGTATYPSGAGGIPSGWTVHKPLPNYFYLEDISGSANTLSITNTSNDVYYSTDESNWTLFNGTATIPANSRLYLKCIINTWNGRNISASGNHNVGGNIMSLLYGDNFQNQIEFTSGSVNNFYELFYNNTKLVSAENLVLPATTLVTKCYGNMFENCTSLTTAPALPATTLASTCYQQMFYGCTSLTTAPALPATTLAQYCYQFMFYNCTALTTAPALPATTLTDSCYNTMFYGCTSLTTAPALPATTLAQYCYQFMFYNCTALTTAPALPATTLADSCYAAMFYGCTALTTAPALPATTLADYCYQGMFSNCTSLTTAPTLPATTLTDKCYITMFNGCTNLNEVTTYAYDIFANRCLQNWLNNVSPTGDFYNLGTATYPSGASGIPSGWTEHTSL